MAEYIEREALIAKYDLVHKGPPGGARKLMVNAPAVDVAPVKYGDWMPTTKDGCWVCSECYEIIVADEYGDIHPAEDCGWLYCPYCGAKMKGGAE